MTTQTAIEPAAVAVIGGVDTHKNTHYAVRPMARAAYWAIGRSPPMTAATPTSGMG
ncbi:hypothetical protein [Amycolatopsis sp. FDAARGOS 1241]|uniref:hypothetical protein n=1 Tax=Amycolatopsis sp. FDAARGOS 1241 TaxID=2778070 RepID=UPI00194F2ECA|nr:hypothetical protein [Amycolatopsis sp. FDAARGOS 1241]QRP48909.1 hypothetical protein I6J71_14495 [Amycolatopsis sp. FDAARGOS 1241]